jgi:hypothetical protein
MPILLIVRSSKEGHSAVQWGWQNSRNPHEALESRRNSTFSGNSLEYVVTACPPTGSCLPPGALPVRGQRSEVRWEGGRELLITKQIPSFTPTTSTSSPKLSPPSKHKHPYVLPVLIDVTDTHFTESTGDLSVDHEHSQAVARWLPMRPQPLHNRCSPEWHQ